MNRTIDRLKLIFLVIFAVCCVIIWSYQAIYVWPRNRCEAKGDWWDPQDRICAVPVPISIFTHRLPGPGTPAAPPAKPASAKTTPPKVTTSKPSRPAPVRPLRRDSD
jgi:hypothetical protein